MTAKELIKVLDCMIKDHGDKEILLRDPASGWYDTVGSTKNVTKTEYNHTEGFLLERVPR